MHVGVYIDGYNLYYGARTQCVGVKHWKWLDVRALTESVIADQHSWTSVSSVRIIYCTARIDARQNPAGQAEQDIYLKALRASGSVDHIEYGKYIVGVRARPLAIRGKRAGDPPIVIRAGWPVMVQSQLGVDQPDALFMVSTLHQEEKGTDVNLASHLIRDVLTSAVDAAVVVSNDSDLKLPVSLARAQVPVGLINPRGGRVAGDLAGKPNDGVGRHWWRTLSKDDYVNYQLPTQIAGYRRPADW